MVKKNKQSQDNWSITDSDRIYRIKKWGDGYYEINESGNISVRPQGKSGPEIDLRLLIDDLRKRKIQLPVLIRFIDILTHRIKSLCNCFEKARKMFDYTGGFIPVYPIKVNQQKQVVEAMIQDSRRYDLGLEVGSKPELMAVLALAPDNKNLIICNGYKDRSFIETALYAKRIGKTIIVVAEQFSEVEKIVTIAREIKVTPALGVRVKLFAKAEGRWSDTGGDGSKFGLRITEIIQIIDFLAEENLLSCLELVHFHIGSQISHIQDIKMAMTEIARVYASLSEMNVSIKFVDVGGGLGIDYDGSSSRNTFSANYSPQEYANDVVYTLKSVCDAEKLAHPTIVTESGRAMTAHFSVLVADVVDQYNPVPQSLPAHTEGASQQLIDLLEMLNEVSDVNCREYYHDAIYARKEATNLFNMGYMYLKERSDVEIVYWLIMKKIQELKVTHKLAYPEFDGLDQLLAYTYVVNFSLFQSLPDCWAIDQIFPIMPIHRLQEEPDRFCTLVDITCDSDGRVANYIPSRDIPEGVVRLHALNENEPYYIGFFLVGAYQEILGDLHNLFGDTNAVHVILGKNGQYKLADHIRGDTIKDVLGYVQYQAHELIALLRAKLERNVEEGLIAVEDATQFLALFEKGLGNYTYLNIETKKHTALNS